MKYFCFYDSSDKEGRTICLSSLNKINYICSSISENMPVEIISTSMNSSLGYFKGRTEIIDKNITLKQFSAYKWGNIFQKVLAKFHYVFTLFFYLIFHVGRNEKIIVYHSVSYINIIKLAKSIKRFRLILEIEEIYGDVSGSSKIIDKELKYFKYADAFIFPTELLNKKINKENKPHCIIYGTYQMEPDRNCKFDDGRIHCVYAGTFDPRKGGISAVSAAAFLDNKYHLHILGFGSEKDKKALLDRIDEVSGKSGCKVTYDGLLSGEEYIRFIQSCHIGLSTQNPDAEFNDSSFPSKILSYMANGLRVVSIRIPAIEISEIGRYMYFYDKQTPEEIAGAIRNVNMSDGYDSRAVIVNLDKKFGEDFKNMITEMK